MGCVHAEALTSRPFTHSLNKHNIKFQISNFTFRTLVRSSVTARHPLKRDRGEGLSHAQLHARAKTARPQLRKTVEISVVGTSGYFTNTFSGGGATTLISSRREPTLGKSHAVISFVMCSSISWNMAVPQTTRHTACNFLRVSTLSIMLLWKIIVDSIGWEQHFRVTEAFQCVSTRSSC